MKKHKFLQPISLTQITLRRLLIKVLPPRLYLEFKQREFKRWQPELYARFQVERNIVTTTSYSYKPLRDTRSIFIHIPKCAGISVSKALYGNLGGGHMTLTEYFNVFKPAEVFSYFKFTIVRNPWDRLVSAFHFLKAGGYGARDRAWNEHELKDFSNFDQFIKGWLTKENIWKCHHFRPQYHYLCDSENKIKLDFIGFFENLDEDFSYIAKKLKRNSTLTKANSSLHGEYQNYYSTDTKEIVAKIYARDIEILGYSFDNSSIKTQLKKRIV